MVGSRSLEFQVHRLILLHKRRLLNKGIINLGNATIKDSFLPFYFQHYIVITVDINNFLYKDLSQRFNVKKRKG